MTTTVNLPEEPKDIDFEDYVAAYLQASGRYIDKSIIYRDQEEILELDIIFSEYYPDKAPTEKLIEIKSGKWGFADMFKIVGWGAYLGISDLNLVVCNPQDNHEFYTDKANDIGVCLSYHPNKKSDLDQSSLIDSKICDPLDVTLFRFALWTERKILKKLKSKKKSCVDKPSYSIMDSYYHGLNSENFFCKNVIERVDNLYSLYKKNPNLSVIATAPAPLSEVSGLGETSQIPSDIFNKTFYSCEFTDLTISTYIEHKARLEIMKSAIDYHLHANYGDFEKVKSDYEMLGYLFDRRDSLPSTFTTALEAVKEHEFFHRYPIFWQHFLWIFGGFILEDYKDEEYKLLSLKTGIPTTEIDNALSSYDLFFPMSGGWFAKATDNSNIRSLKMMPIPFKGIGANLRRLHYHSGCNEKPIFEELSKLTGTYTLRDLLKWNNACVELLAS